MESRIVKKYSLLTVIIWVSAAVAVVSAAAFLWHNSEVKRIKRNMIESALAKQKSPVSVDSIIASMKTDSTQSDSTDLMEIYGSDREAVKEEVNFYVKIPRDKPLADRIKILAEKLSRFRFEDNPITLLRIENRYGKKVAVINLEEPAWSGPNTWSGMYFQGSTGGRFTSSTLVLTFLQEGYKGEWIDGVQFYYQGKPFSSDWDHINLSGTFFRKQTQG